MGIFLGDFGDFGQFYGTLELRQSPECLWMVVVVVVVVMVMVVAVTNSH